MMKRFLVMCVCVGAGALAGCSKSDSDVTPPTAQPLPLPPPPIGASESADLQSTDFVVGTGEAAKTGDRVTVNYTGSFNNGMVFDASKPGDPFTFTLGAHQVIAGWDQGVVGMKVGGKRRLVIPPGLAYGAQGQGPIPPNTTLHFDIELLSINK